MPRCESRGLTNGDSPFYPLGHKALFRHLTDGASAGALRRGASGNRGPDLDLREATEKTRKLPHL